MRRLLCPNRKNDLSASVLLCVVLPLCLHSQAWNLDALPTAPAPHCDTLSPLPLKQLLSLALALGHDGHSPLSSHQGHYHSLHVAALGTFIQLIRNCVLPLLKALLCLGIRVA